MARRNRRWDPPLPGPCANHGPSMSESISIEERNGVPVGPYVELRPKSPPLTITEAGPLPLPPDPPPFDRAAALTGLQAAFALLADDELQVAQLRMLGTRLIDISEELGFRDDEVEKLWKQARRKLGEAIFGGNEPDPTPVASAASASADGKLPHEMG